MTAKNIMLATLAVFAAGGAEAGKAAAEAKPLRMVTYNIYSDWRAPKWGVPPRAAGIERTIVKAQPDIVALQEVAVDWWESPLFGNLAANYGIVRGDEAEAIRRAGPPPVTKPGKPEKGRCNHTPLLYRKDRLSLLDSGYDIFHIALGGISKSVTWAVLEDKFSGRRFLSFSTHFWFKHNCPEDDAIRELNARNILRHVADVRRKWGEIPVIGGGDLNCKPGSLALETFRREGFSNAMDVAAEKTARSATRTYHGRLQRDEKSGQYHGTVAPPGMDKPEQSIDHIFFIGGIRALRYDIDVDAEALDASDHSPVIVDFLIECDTAKPCAFGRKLEHLAINVSEPVKVAEWWCRNLGMEVVRSGPPPIDCRFIRDFSGTMCIELYHNPSDRPGPDYAAKPPLEFHIGVECDDPETDAKRLVAAGAQLVEIEHVQGMTLAMMRDPWGICLQLCKRPNPVLKK